LNKRVNTMVLVLIFLFSIGLVFLIPVFHQESKEVHKPIEKAYMGQFELTSGGPYPQTIDVWIVKTGEGDKLWVVMPRGEPNRMAIKANMASIVPNTVKIEMP
jgi:hypothetical protein